MRATKNSPASYELRGHADDRRYPVSDSQHIPDGFCQCGCGQRVERWEATDRWAGRVKGEYKRFVNHHNRRRDPGERFDGLWRSEDRGHETPCWIWQGTTKAGAGYGRFPVWTAGKCKQWQAHRWAYVRHVGEIADGLELDHLCGVPSCVNPAHLEPVTGRTNRRRAGQVKLVEAEVRAIKQGPKADLQYLARRYAVDPSTIQDIWAGRSWRDV